MFELLTYYKTNAGSESVREEKQFSEVSDAEKRGEEILKNDSVLKVEIIDSGTKIVINSLQKTQMYELLTYYETSQGPDYLRGYGQYSTVSAAEEHAEDILENDDVLWMEVVKTGTEEIVKSLKPGMTLS